MAANTTPIYSRTPDIQWPATKVTAANTAMDGTGTVTTVFTADATEGGRIEELRCTPDGTNVATVLRIFVNNGSVNTTAANNALIKEVSLPSTTASAVQAGTGVVVPLGLSLPPGYKINITLGQAVAAGWRFAGIGGKY